MAEVNCIHFSLLVTVATWISLLKIVGSFALWNYIYENSICIYIGLVIIKLNLAHPLASTNKQINQPTKNLYVKIIFIYHFS